MNNKKRKPGAGKARGEGNNIAAMAEVRQRIKRALEMRLWGITNLDEIAAGIGVDPQTVNNYLKQAREWIREQNAAECNEMVDIAAAQLDLASEKAMRAFEQSRQPAEKVTTDYRRKKCLDCKGTGWDAGNEETGEWCVSCNGDGIIMVEDVTKEVKGQAGDSSHLKLYKECVAERAKLLGLYPDKKVKVEMEGRILQANINFENAPPELLLEAMQALDRVKQAIPMLTDERVVEENR